MIKSVISTVGDILKFLLELPAALIEKFGELLKALFIPDDDYFSGKLATMRREIVFVDDIIEAVEMYKDSVGNTKGAPTITADLGRYGGEVKILDLSFYEPYKNYGDMIISAFMWGCFIWRCFMHLHVTVRGEDTVKTDNIDIKGG